jgi:hypothetical protein
MEDIAKVLAEFRRELRLAGFTESEAFKLTTTYMVELLRGSLTADPSPERGER